MYENSYLKIIKKTCIYKTSLEPFSVDLRKYIVMILCPHVSFLGEVRKGH